MLSHSQARNIAESMWGRGGTHSEPTNRRGAFYFSCSGHGGFVIDTRALSPAEMEAIRPHLGEFDKATEYRWGNHRFLFHPYQRRRTARVSMSAEVTEFEFFTLEEDCAWCLAYTHTGIRHRNKPAKLEAAQETFDRYFKKEVA